jgi:hypothetical protein
MATNLQSPPNFITIVQNEVTGRAFQLVCPDGDNPPLRLNGMPMRFYFVPQYVFPAKKQTAPADFDFGMIVVKGLLSGETNLSVPDSDVSSGNVEVGGGSL